MTEKLQNKINGAKSEEEVKTILVIISMPVGVKSYRFFDCQKKPCRTLGFEVLIAEHFLRFSYDSKIVRQGGRGNGGNTLLSVVLTGGYSFRFPSPAELEMP